MTQPCILCRNVYANLTHMPRKRIATAVDKPGFEICLLDIRYPSLRIHNLSFVPLTGIEPESSRQSSGTVYKTACFTISYRGLYYLYAKDLQSLLLHCQFLLALYSETDRNIIYIQFVQIFICLGSVIVQIMKPVRRQYDPTFWSICYEFTTIISI